MCSSGRWLVSAGIEPSTSRERRRGRVEADEEERAPRLDARGRKVLLLLLEAAHAVPLGRGLQPAVEAVGPAVVAAHQGLAVARAARDRAGAVAADVREGVDRAVLGAGDDERLVRHGAGEVVARKAHLLGVADELPGLREDPVLLEREHPRIAVPGRGDRRRERKVLLEIEVRDRQARLLLRGPGPCGRRRRGGRAARSRCGGARGTGRCAPRSSRAGCPGARRGPGSSSSVRSASWKRSTVHSIIETIISSSMSLRISPRSTPIRTNAAVPYGSWSRRNRLISCRRLQVRAVVAEQRDAVGDPVLAHQAVGPLEPVARASRRTRGP